MACPALVLIVDAQATEWQRRNAERGQELLVKERDTLLCFCQGKHRNVVRVHNVFDDGGTTVAARPRQPLAARSRHVVAYSSGLDWCAVCKAPLTASRWPSRRRAPSKCDVGVSL